MLVKYWHAYHVAVFWQALDCHSWREVYSVGLSAMRLQIIGINSTGWTSWVHKLSLWNGGETRMRDVFKTLSLQLKAAHTLQLPSNKNVSATLLKYNGWLVCFVLNSSNPKFRKGLYPFLYSGNDLFLCKLVRNVVIFTKCFLILGVELGSKACPDWIHLSCLNIASKVTNVTFVL